MRYLLLTYYRKATGQIDEAMTVSRRLKKSDLQTVNVILDFQNQVVVRCNMDGVVVPRDWDHIVAYYYQHYSATIERLFNENGHPINIEKPQLVNSD